MVVIRSAGVATAASSAPDVVLADELFAATGLLRRHSRRLGGGPFASQALSGAQLELVRLVRREPGLSVADAAGRLALAPNTVSTLVGRLVEAGIVVRDPDPSDRRVARLTLTADAFGRVMRWRDQRALVTARAIAALDAADRDVLAAAVPVIARLGVAIGPVAARTPAEGSDDE